MNEWMTVPANRVSVDQVQARDKPFASPGIAVAKKQVDIAVDARSLGAGSVGGGKDDLRQRDDRLVLVIVEERRLPIQLGSLLRPGGRDSKGSAEFQQIAAMHDAQQYKQISACSAHSCVR